MSAFAIVATIEVAAADIERVEAALLAHRDRCLRDEPGSLQFDVLRPIEGEGRLMLYEVYRDAAAFEAHWNGPSLKQFRAETEGIELKLSGIRCARRD